MAVLADLSLLAHAGDHGHAGEAALMAVGVAAIVIPFIVLVVVGRLFYRASRGAAEPPAPSAPKIEAGPPAGRS